MACIKPPFLTEGDLVAVISTARKISPEEVLPALDLLESWGLRVACGPNLYCSEGQFAGTDSQRAADLQWALDNAEVKAVLCARGGYGTARIIDAIDFSGFRMNPKWLVGFSDVTVLLNHVAEHCSVQSLHAPMAFNLQTSGNESREALHKALFGALSSLEWEARVYREGSVYGKFSGGNLSILYSLCGTPSWRGISGDVLFVEDLDEYLYHLDRMMITLGRSGKLGGASALIMGYLSGMHDNKVAFGLPPEDIIASVFMRYNAEAPVAALCPAGHSEPNFPLYIGAPVRFSCSGDKALIEWLR
jgi:muramoyltetrapeptide carboxypeptidase